MAISISNTQSVLPLDAATMYDSSDMFIWCDCVYTSIVQMAN